MDDTCSKTLFGLGLDLVRFPDPPYGLSSQSGNQTSLDPALAEILLVTAAPFQRQIVM